jgi:hypothetical protein
MLAPVQPSRLDDARGLLEQMGDDPGHCSLMPFAEVEGTHFARFFLTEPTTDPGGLPVPPELVFMADFDAPLEARLDRLMDVGEQGWSRLFACCAGFPEQADRAACRRFLLGHSIRDAAYYVNTVGLSAEQAAAEARLRGAIEEQLDAVHELRAEGPEGVRRSLVDWVSTTEDLAWALAPPAPPGLRWRLGELAHLLLVPLMGLVLLPLVLLALPFWLVALRLHETSDPAPDLRPDPRHTAALEAIEDHGPVNQFTAVGYIKPGPFRAFTARLVLFLIAYGARHLFNHGSLAGVKTIHFARWTFIDGGRRVIFASSYDGSPESYMDDFIDKVAWGLNAVFSNGVGYPATRWLLWEGARNESAFKDYLRVHQVPTQVWYSARGPLTALNVNNNTAIRRGLSSQVELDQWLGRL